MSTQLHKAFLLPFLYLVFEGEILGRHKNVEFKEVPRFRVDDVSTSPHIDLHLLVLFVSFIVSAMCCKRVWCVCCGESTYWKERHDSFFESLLLRKPPA